MADLLLEPRLLAVVQGWEPRWKSLFIERAAIREYHGGQTRARAEQAAFFEVARMRKDANEET